MINLWVMANIVGWAEICYKGMASRGIDLNPQRMYNPYLCLFFISFIIFGALFILNLFVGGVISTYNRQKDQLGGNYLLTENEKKWLETKYLILKCKPKLAYKIPTGRFRFKMYTLAKS
jgi:hypothetical protein